MTTCGCLGFSVLSGLFVSSVSFVSPSRCPDVLDVGRTTIAVRCGQSRVSNVEDEEGWRSQGVDTRSLFRDVLPLVSFLLCPFLRGVGPARSDTARTVRLGFRPRLRRASMASVRLSPVGYLPGLGRK